MTGEEIVAASKAYLAGMIDENLSAERLAGYNEGRASTATELATVYLENSTLKADLLLANAEITTLKARIEDLENPEEPEEPEEPQPTITMLMGCSDSPNDHGGTEIWDGWRVYTRSAMYRLANRTGAQRPKFLAYSEGGNNLGGANPVYEEVLAHARAELETFFYNRDGSKSARWGMLFFWSNGNENHDKGAITLPHTAAKIAAYCRSQKALYDAVHTLNADGSRRYPHAFAGSNPTHEAEMSGEVEGWLHASAQWHDFVMWSMYPPGRKLTEADPTFNWPSLKEADRLNRQLGYMVRCYARTRDAMMAARAATGNPKFTLMIGTGEIGIGNDPDDSTTRPYFAAHGLAGTMVKLSKLFGLPQPFACWWDQQKASTADDPGPHPQNILSDEQAGTDPPTRVAWQNWKSFNHEFGGTHPASWNGNPKSSWKTTGTPS